MNLVTKFSVNKRRNVLLGIDRNDSRFDLVHSQTSVLSNVLDAKLLIIIVDSNQL
jgi:hypothetical protein